MTRHSRKSLGLTAGRGELAAEALPLLVPVLPVTAAALLPATAKHVTQLQAAGSSGFGGLPDPEKLPHSYNGSTAVQALASDDSSVVPLAGAAAAAEITGSQNRDRGCDGGIWRKVGRSELSGSCLPATNCVAASAEGASGKNGGDILTTSINETVAEPIKKQQHIFLTSPPGVGKTTMVQKLLAMLKAEEGDDGVKVVGFYTEEVRDEKGQRCGFDVIRVGGGSPDAPPRSVLARIGQSQPRVGKYSVDVTAFEEFALPALAKRKPQPVLPKNPRLYIAPDGTAEAVGLLAEDDNDNTDSCRIFVPSLEQEIFVNAPQLQSVPDEWKPQHDAMEDDTDDESRPRLCVCDEVGKMELLSLRFPPEFLATLDSGAVVLGTLPQPARGQIDPEVVEQVKRRPDVRVMRITRNNRDALTGQVYMMLRESLGLGPPGTGNPKPNKRKAAERERREAAEREERDRAAAKERERAAKKERQAARERERALKAKELAKKRKILAQKAREQRKARALLRKRAQEAAKGGVMAVEDEAESDSLEFEDDIDDVEDVDTVEDVDAVVDVDDKKLIVRKVPSVVGLRTAALATSGLKVPPRLEPKPSQKPTQAGAPATGPSIVMLE